MEKRSKDEILIPEGDKAVEAEYLEQMVADYKENPLIEALPPILSADEASEKIAGRPPMDKKERELDIHYRLHCIQRLFHFLEPLNNHMEIEQMFSRVIRQGYLHRNPLGSDYAASLCGSYKMEKDLLAKADDYKKITTASGFTIIGISGVGKTTAVERILSLYPQIIVHSEYKGNHLSLYQISYLKLDCPFDGSVKGLCANFFNEVDRLLGTNYYKHFGSSRNSTVDYMVPKMAHVSSLHCIGVLVIDEIQHLSAAKSGGAEKMLNFFVNLVNVMGIPVVLIGTPKAQPILQGEFRQGRRGSGQGAVVWDRMKDDAYWELFVEGMWDYQWTKKETELTDELKNILYEESQGIIDIAVKLYAMSQIRALVTKIETITPKIISQVTKDSFQLVKPALDALKSGDPERIKLYGDISSSVEFDEFMRKNISAIRIQTLSKKKEDKKDNTLPVLEQLVLKLLELDIEPKVAQKAAERAISELGTKEELSSLQRHAIQAAFKEEENKKEKTEKNQKTTTDVKRRKSNDLRLISELAKKKKEPTYDYLKEASYIKNPVEEFIMGR